MVVGKKAANKPSGTLDALKKTVFYAAKPHPLISDAALIYLWGYKPRRERKAFETINHPFYGNVIKLT